MDPLDEGPPSDVISIVDTVTQQYCRYIRTCCLSTKSNYQAVQNKNVCNNVFLYVPVSGSCLINCTIDSMFAHYSKMFNYITV